MKTSALIPAKDQHHFSAVEQEHRARLVLVSLFTVLLDASKPFPLPAEGVRVRATFR